MRPTITPYGRAIPSRARVRVGSSAGTRQGLPLETRSHWQIKSRQSSSSPMVTGAGRTHARLGCPEDAVRELMQPSSTTNGAAVVLIDERHRRYKDASRGDAVGLAVRRLSALPRHVWDPAFCASPRTSLHLPSHAPASPPASPPASSGAVAQRSAAQHSTALPAMASFNLETCARANILALQPYRCARDDYKDDGTNILLDANENAYGPSLAPADVDTARGVGGGLDPLGLHRYPDPHQRALKQLLCDLRNTHAHTQRALTPDNLFVGVGSDEAVDALLRCFCVPGRDRILTCPPTYGMYAVAAQVNDVAIVSVPLLPAPGFALDVAAVRAALDDEGGCVKIVYLCSPGNPTGSLLAKADVEQILAHPTWNGIVVLDEAYVDFAPDGASLAELVAEHPNLVVMQTLSKAFGMAGIRLGAAFASAPVARLLNSLKAPYNISSPTSALAACALRGPGLAVMRQNRARV
ncbi:Histidinol-phosphate aminotransferase, partial [Tolypocladium paradoxum]